ncbi:uncharacterized protein BDV17DRAFT_290701 [Aspergillus undulatus]|uniref:uncharacterized protein n=1 Tax=Aspergillus undulatus TaxID=1810928 RepID=UPI003CCE4891
MAFTKVVPSFVALLSTLIPTCYAQAPQGAPYADPANNITFSTWDIPSSSGTGPLKYGFALPPTSLVTDASDFIGYLQCTPVNGWCGISLGGSMTESLLLVAYADTNSASKTVKYTLRFTSEYNLPGVYSGNATILPISTDVTADSFTSIFLCRNCLQWEQGESVGGASTSGGMLDLAFAVSPEGPTRSECADEAVFVRHENQGTWVAFVDEGAVNGEYDSWAALAEDAEGDGC